MDVLPSRNVTDPVAVQHGETVAVNVTACPKAADPTLALTAIVVLSATFCSITAEDPLYLPSPLYVALIE